VKTKHDRCTGWIFQKDPKRLIYRYIMIYPDISRSRDLPAYFKEEDKIMVCSMGHLQRVQISTKLLPSIAMGDPLNCAGGSNGDVRGTRVPQVSETPKGIQTLILQFVPK